MKSQARKKDIPHHRGRRGFFWGDPGKGKLACQDREDS